MRRLRWLLDPTEWRFLGAIWVPMASMIVGLKVNRIAWRPDTGSAPVASLVRSEICLASAFLLVGVGLLRLTRSSEVGAKVGRAVVAGLGGLILLTNGLSHLFYRATGSIMTWPLIRHAWRRVDELAGMIQAGTSITIVGLIVVLAVVLQVLPWMLFAGESEVAREADRSVLGRVVTGVCLLGAIVFGLLAWSPVDIAQYRTGFVREPFLHLTTTYLSGQGPVERETEMTRRAPEKTRLVPAESTGDRPRKNVALIVLESTGWQATSLDDSGPETTPYLEKLAEESLVMEEAYTVVPHTSKALVSILCGISPAPRMAILETMPDGIPGRCLPELLGRRGWETGFFQTAIADFEDRRRLVDNMGVGDFFALEDLEPDKYQKVNYLGIEEWAMLPRSRKWLRGRGDEPFFATYLTLSPHHDYQFSDRFGRREFVDGEMQNRYLNAVRYVDRFVERLVEQYRRLGLYEETIFVIIGDHGEAFGEHGRWQHDNVPYQEVLHVPWLIHSPGEDGLEAGTIERRVNLLDLLPTVASLLDYEVVGGDYPGEPIREVEAGRTQFFKCFYDRKCVGAMRGRYKYVHHYGYRADELFNLEDDPGEAENLAGEFPDKTSQLRERVLDWQAALDQMYRRHWESRSEANKRRDAGDGVTP